MLIRSIYKHHKLNSDYKSIIIGYPSRKSVEWLEKYSIIINKSGGNDMKSLLCIAAIASAMFMPIMASAQTPAKTLVAYYSWSGNTKIAAEVIAKTTGADLFEIVPVKAYPSDYKTCTEQAKEEINANARPELKDFPKDLSAYNKIYIGSPNWWGTMAPPVASFIEKCGDLNGKTIVPFFTHGGGGMQNYEKDVRAIAEKNNGKVWPAQEWPGAEVKNLTDEIRMWAERN